MNEARRDSYRFEKCRELRTLGIPMLQAAVLPTGYR